MSALFIVITLMACSHSDYEEGNGAYSFLQADFADVTIRSSKVVDITTDEGIKLIPSSELSYSQYNDTTLRQLIYYNKESNTQPIDIIAQRSVRLLVPLDKSYPHETTDDPIGLTAIWLTNNNKYINIRLSIKVGSSESLSTQTISLRRDSISEEGNGATWLTLLHNQNNMPQYYSQEILMSIPLASLPTTDTIHININTTKGPYHKDFIIER